MAIYAKIEDSMVTNIIVCNQEDIASIPGIHVRVTDDTNNPIVGSYWNQEVQKFIAPQPYPSWTLNSQYKWESPEGPEPEGLNYWNESTLSWEPFSL